MPEEKEESKEEKEIYKSFDDIKDEA